MDFHAYSGKTIATKMLPGPAAVVQLADSADLLAKIKDQANVVAQLAIIFNDAQEDFGLVRAPRIEDARRIVEFAAVCTAPHFVVQCEHGIGRSHAVVAALAKTRGLNVTAILRHGT